MSLSYKNFTFGYSFDDNKEVVSLIFINYFILLLFSFVAILIHTGEDVIYPISYRYHGLVVAGALNLVLIRFRWIRLAKILLLIIPPVALIILPPLFKLFDNEYYFWFPYAPTAISIIPHFILHPRRERFTIGVTISAYLVLTVLADDFMTYMGGDVLPVFQIVEQHQFYYNLVPLFVFIFVNLALGLLFQQNSQYEEMLRSQGEALNHQNTELSEQKEELQVKNNELDRALRELQNTQDLLIQSEKLASLGTLTAGIGHELNNPLNFICVSIDGLSDALEKLRAGESDDKENREQMVSELEKYISFAREGAGRSTEIVRKLSSLKLREVRTRQRLAVKDIYDAAIHRLAPLIKSEVTMQADIPADLELNCDREKILKVMTNILANALDAIGENPADVPGMVTTLAKSVRINETNHIEISFINNGPAIPGEVMDKIYDPFFSTKSDPKSPGLGLSMVYNIVKEHAGKITVSSSEEQTAVKIQLPVNA